MTLATILGQLTTSPRTMAKPPMLKVSRIAQIDNLDQGDALGANRSDFYLIVNINGKDYKTEKIADDDGRPNWMIPLDLTKRYNKFKISAWDDDGGLERQDDHADISPRKGEKNLFFTYDRYTGQLWGDVDGWFGQTIVSEGKGDDDKARIEFSIVK